MTDFEIHSGGTALQSLPDLAAKRRTRLNDEALKLLEAANLVEVDEAEFFLLWDLQRLAQTPHPALLALLLAESAALANGSTYLSLAEDDLADSFKAMRLPAATRKRYLAEISAIIERETQLFQTLPTNQLTPFYIDSQQQRLFRQGFYLAEANIATALLQRSQQPWQHLDQLANPLRHITQTAPLGTQPHDHPERIVITLAAEQLEAATLAACAPLTMITGGPGTGKTSIVISLLRILAQLNYAGSQVGLAAPTGRAAVRVWESIRKGLSSLPPIEAQAPFFQDLAEPTTLHRMLAWSPQQRAFRYNSDNPLPFDWLIIDEASMIDLNLVEPLLDAAKPNAHLIFLGDADQLPAVEAGAFFRDVSQNPPDLPGSAIDKMQTRQGRQDFARQVVQLRTSFRQKGHRGGQHVYAVAQRILNQGGQGLVSATASTDHIPDYQQSDRAPSWQGVSLLQPQHIAPETFINWLLTDIYQPHLQRCAHPLADLADPRLDAIFANFNQFRLLCVTRTGNWGVDHLNHLISKRLTPPGQESRHLPGLPLMVTRNDYAMGLYNGDLGLLLHIQDEDGSIGEWLIFQEERGYRKLRRAWLSGLETAFAMTVHKSQGTEAEQIALVLPDRVSPLNRKEVIYTALTRAKRGAWIYGDQGLLETACSQRMSRKTSLSEQLS